MEIGGRHDRATEGRRVDQRSGCGMTSGGDHGPHSRRMDRRRVVFYLLAIPLFLALFLFLLPLDARAYPLIRHIT